VDKVKIISIFDKNEIFIELQYNSILKHIKCPFDYVIFNNASSEEQAIKNEDICKKLNIECIRIYTNYKQDPSNIAGNGLNEAFKHIGNEKIFKIDSDMFFISDIDLLEILSKNDLFYISNKRDYFDTMWSGIFGLNLNNVSDKIDFRPNVIPSTDTFGQSCLLLGNENYSRKEFYLLSMHNVENNILRTSFNNDCLVDINLINNYIKIQFSKYEINNIYINKSISYLETFKNNNFPTPYLIDIIYYDNIDFVIHFKSSNWTNFNEYGENYFNNKLNAINTILKK
jgi:hypothetical protein